MAPRPIGWISTVDPEGRVNLAPYSFYNAFSEAPPIVGFASGGRKDSQQNVEATGEFVCNLVTRKHALAMNLTSAPFPHGVNEMERASLAAAPSRLVRPPRVADAPAALECKLLLVLPLSDLDGKATGNTLILGQVVGGHIDRAILTGGLFGLAVAGTLAGRATTCGPPAGGSGRPRNDSAPSATAARRLNVEASGAAQALPRRSCNAAALMS